MVIQLWNRDTRLNFIIKSKDIPIRYLPTASCLKKKNNDRTSLIKLCWAPNLSWICKYILFRCTVHNWICKHTLNCWYILQSTIDILLVDAKKQNNELFDTSKASIREQLISGSVSLILHVLWSCQNWWIWFLNHTDKGKNALIRLAERKSCFRYCLHADIDLRNNFNWINQIYNITKKKIPYIIHILISM